MPWLNDVGRKIKITLEAEFLCLLIPSEVIKNIQIVSTPKNPYLNQGTLKNTCQIFLLQKLLRSSPSLEIQGISPGELLRVN